MASVAPLRRHADDSLFRVLLSATCARLLSLLYLLVVHPRLVGSYASFDTSADLLASTVDADDDLGALVHVTRWDALYFTSIALHGYRHEQELAFLPGWPLAMRAAAEAVRWIVGGDVGLRDIVLAGTLLANLLSVVACGALYSLTKLVYPAGGGFAEHVAILYAISPAPAVMSSPYTEPAFAALTFSGFLLVEKAQRGARGHLSRLVLGLFGTALLAAATSIRSLGMLSVVLVAWRGIVDPLLQGRNLRHMTRVLLRRKLVAFATAAQCLLVVSPFFAFQWVAYRGFCLVESHAVPRRPWCDAKLPLVYGWVQEHYWNVGFMRYWELAQVPNFLLAAPILAFSLWTTVNFARSRPFNARLAPYHLISAITTYVLVFSAHTQIALRVCTGGGFGVVVFWGAAQLKRDGLKGLGRAWLRWSVVYGAVSLVLWAGFYPPA